MGKKMFNKNNTNVLPKRVLEAKKNKGQNKTFERESNEEYDDEVDTFIKGKDKVSFDRAAEEEDDTVEPVMDLEIPDSDQEDENEEEDDDDDDFKTRMMMKRLGAGYDDDDEVDDDDQDIESMYDQKWGKGKKSYYSTDVKSDNKQKKTNKIDFDAQDAEDAEEEEVKRLQKKKAALLSASDFDDDLQVEETMEEKSKKKPSTEQKLLQNVRKDLESINFDMDDKSAVIESVRKDLSNLTKEEKLELIMNDSPELLTLLEDFKECISEITEKLDPLLSKVKSGDMPTGKGVSYLEVKYHLLLSYCTNISFYLLMKANGKSVKDHPVIDQLVRIRTILERLKPLDKKLSYQINKLLTLAATGALRVDGKDPRSFRPNPEALENDEEEEVEQVSKKKTGVYKIPKLQEMHFEEERPSQRYREDRERKRAESSQMMKFIRQEYGDEPEEEANIGSDKRNVDPEMKRRAEYEEDMYIRLALTKEDKKRLNRKEREVDELQSLADFGDIAAVTRKKDEDANAILTKKTIRDVIHKIKDDDKKRKGVHFGVQDEEQDFDDLAMEEALTDENAFKPAKKSKKQKQQQPREAEEEEEEMYEDSSHTPGEKRGINYAIEKNRGLTRHRSRETKTPRTRLRNKYDKAVAKRSSAVRKMADKSRPYAGESTGIKSNLVRSVKLKF